MLLRFRTSHGIEYSAQASGTAWGSQQARTLTCIGLAVGRSRVVCASGRRPGPAEDCGGVCGYELIAAATDPTHADHADAVAEYARHFGLDADPASLRLPRSTSMRSTTLVDLDLDDTTSQIDLPEPLDELSTR